MRALALLAVLALAATAAAEPRTRCGTCSLIPAGATGSDLTMSGTVTAQKFSSTQSSGANAFEVTVNGARIDFGTGASDYCTSDGSIITCSADLAAATNMYATVFRGGGAGANYVNLHGSAGININAASSGSVTATVGAGGAVTGHVVLVPYVSTTGVGNLGASGPDDLQTYQLPASGLTIAGTCLRITAKGTTANNANAKAVRLAFGATPTALVTKQLTASIAGRWTLSATICRTGASAQDYFAEAVNYGGTTVSSTDGATVALLSNHGTLTETETNALNIKVQSTTLTTDNDIVSELLIVEYL